MSQIKKVTKTELLVLDSYRYFGGCFNLKISKRFKQANFIRYIGNHIPLIMVASLCVLGRLLKKKFFEIRKCKVIFDNIATSAGDIYFSSSQQKKYSHHFHHRFQAPGKRKVNFLLLVMHKVLFHALVQRVFKIVTNTLDIMSV